jgi:flagellar biosynthesis GTPase FlhF
VAVAPVAPPVPAWPPVAPAPAAAPPAPAIAVEPDLPPAPRTPPAAALAEQRLVTAGLTPALAAEVVGETVAHVVPFHADADLDGLVRASLARRISIMSGLGTGRRVLAVAGSGGAGKSAIVARLAARYAASEHEVVVIALGTRDGGGELADQLEPLGVSVIAAADAEQAQRRMRHREPTLCIVDTPALGVHDAAAAAALAPQLRALGCTEVHLAVPATVSAVAADEVATALAPLGITHMAITNVDQTARPGAVVELALRTGRPVSYLGSRERVELADAGVLAARLLP